MKRTIITAAMLAMSVAACAADITVDTAKARQPISKYIYGVNQDIAANTNYTARRLGGNRMTGYNWENNASNAGNDWQQSSDNYLLDSLSVPVTDQNEAGKLLTVFQEKSITMNAYSIITLPLAGFVAKDKGGPVGPKEAAPSDRWAAVVFEKGKELSLDPDKGDDKVYLDEEINFLVNRFGRANTPTGVKGYELDNEPDLWNSTHPRLHPNKTGAEEYIQKSVKASEVVKKMDPYAEVYGPASYGFNGFRTFQDAPDYIQAQWKYGWYLAYYMHSMAEASKKDGKRLLDVLDVHWYPEATQNGKRIVFSQGAAEETAEARVQSPRSLWDKDYSEQSWICSSGHCPMALIPTIQELIDKNYPGTKLAFTEYEYGAGFHPSGGIAQADVLGIFGKYGVYMANYWMVELGAYTLSAFRLYRNYDGNYSTYGDTNIKADTSDAEQMSAYASITGKDDRTLHIIVINKDLGNTETARVTIKSPEKYTHGQAYGFDKASPAITLKETFAAIKGNKLSFVMPPLSAYHLVLTK
jgi:mannan endo-1,4-beta-mannosidase